MICCKTTEPLGTHICVLNANQAVPACAWPYVERLSTVRASLTARLAMFYEALT